MIPIIVECRCEAKTAKGERCPLCMGSDCSNQTYEHNGIVYNLVEATLLWPLNRYDGPLSGIAVCGALPCYAKTYTYWRDRTFWLYPLRFSEWRDELVFHTRWITAIGNFTDIRSPFRDDYVKRKPIGFFRLRGGSNPLESNRLVEDAHRQKSYEHLFALEVESSGSGSAVSPGASS